MKSALVILGRSQIKRESPAQWENKSQAPRVVLETLSSSDTAQELLAKQVFYSQRGALELYFYAPESNEFWGLARTTLQQGFKLLTEFDFPWVSPTLGIRFELFEDGLAVFHPDGDLFKDPEVILDERNQAQQERDRAFAKLRELGVDPEQL